MAVRTVGVLGVLAGLGLAPGCAGLPGGCCSHDPTSGPPVATVPSTPAQHLQEAPLAQPAIAPHAHTNRLAAESSPYLLQHAHNPVDWYPWGEEAFERARREDRPIFLSVGYSTCHWCHVMERESFEDEDLARYLNLHFVSIKVDREERPDVDAVYMAATQAMTGSGGWPMSVFLDHELRPFYAGTYFPPEDRYGRPGFRTLLSAIAGAWSGRREDLRQAGLEVQGLLDRQAAAGPVGALGAEVLQRALEALASAYDPAEGGFGEAPKFPRSHTLSFLLRQGRRSGDPRALEMVEATLDRMARGGIHDHLGGGFHRYSTDVRWLVPHFEKMLYDQALLARSYLEAYQVTGRPARAAVARDTLDYVLRDLRDEAGGFHSAEDADSEGVEGRFYVWTRPEVLQVLGEAEGSLFSRVYGVVDGGNYAEEAGGGARGANILHLRSTLEEVAPREGMAVSVLEERLAAGRGRLLERRSGRVRPHLDDKVLADWNGLMIGSLAYAARALGEPAYAREAARAADFVLTRMRRPDGRLLHRYRQGAAGVPAYLDDHAFLALGLLELYEADFDPRWLREALGLAREMERLFHDPAAGGFFLSGSDAESLIARTREVYDGAIPSGNSVAAWVLVRLGRLTGDERLESLGRSTLEAFSGALARGPVAYPVSLMALDFLLGPTREIVLSGDPADPVVRAMRDAVHRRFLPDAVLAARPAGEGASEIDRLIPFLADLGEPGARPTAYVCRGRVCALPATDVAGIEAQLQE